MTLTLENFDLIKCFIEQQTDLWGKENIFLGMEVSKPDPNAHSENDDRVLSKELMQKIPVVEAKEIHSKRGLKFSHQSDKLSQIQTFSERLHSYNNESFLGSGSIRSKVMFVSALTTQENFRNKKIYSEDVQGVFVRMLKKMMFELNEIYLTPAFKFFIEQPSNNDKMLARNILKEQLKIIGPRYLFLLGEKAAHIFLENELEIDAMRGQVYNFHGKKTIVTHCPSKLVESKSLFWEVYEDMKLFRKIYDSEIGDKPPMA
ncbi:MAG: hypothetical protein DWQ10_08040 [Calditrichaeota bacterium]|nr:MAG: hypothetical protein DWQ10_08040 [Calditrichota bacterium]